MEDINLSREEYEAIMAARRRRSERRTPWGNYVLFVLLILVLLAALAVGVMQALAWLPVMRQSFNVSAPLPTASVYIQNVGAQAPHYPRSEAAPVAPPAATPIPGVYSPAQSEAVYQATAQATLQQHPAMEQAPVMPASPAVAVPVPTVDAAYAETIGAQQRVNAEGLRCLPRSGCSKPGDGGALPWPQGR